MGALVGASGGIGRGERAPKSRVRMKRGGENVRENYGNQAVRVRGPREREK